MTLAAQSGSGLKWPCFRTLGKSGGMSYMFIYVPGLTFVTDLSLVNCLLWKIGTDRYFYIEYLIKKCYFFSPDQFQYLRVMHFPFQGIAIKSSSLFVINSIYINRASAWDLPSHFPVLIDKSNIKKWLLISLISLPKKPSHGKREITGRGQINSLFIPLCSYETRAPS